ncbi:rhodanese domain-containing protein CG4456-like [Drosophila albomicans]|uniref:Rhodanese domain-containing protein CG4456-like n=1 Tax=Drosophila albomicans TaxID=7291 RepID=A0A6P8XR26_DROAB|nr:rhodanese domain-containing protein CG4456-like [Drosophila albomicans]
MKILLRFEWWNIVLNNSNSEMFKTIFCSIRPKVRNILGRTNKSWPNFAYSTNNKSIGKVDFNAVKRILETPDKLVIDVRTVKEVEETGEIPGSINIDMDLLTKVLGDSTSQLEFYTLFGRVKPSTSTQLIFSCRSGERARKSAEQAIDLGYTNVWVYEGSWIDWYQKTKELNNNN